MQTSPTTRRRLIGIIVAALCLYFVVAAFDPFEPRYQGQSLSEWTDVLLDDSQRTEHAQAENAIRHIGYRALPYAIKWTKMTRHQHGSEILDRLDRHGIPATWLENIFHDDVQFVGPEDRSACIFKVLGSQATSAIPTLVNLMGDCDLSVAGAAVGDLSNIGPRAGPALTQALTNQNGQIRQYAAALLAQFPSLSDQALRALVATLADSEPHARAAAASTLGSHATNAPWTVVPALVNALTIETNVVCQGEMISVIGRFGTNAQSAVPLLRQLLNSPTLPSSPLELRWLITNALYKIASPPTANLKTNFTPTL